MNLIATVCEGSGSVNEDGIGMLGAPGDIRAAWVFDGVTGINDRAYLPGRTDAAWFVARADHHLRRALAAELPARETLAEVVLGLRADQTAALAGMALPERFDPPAACLVAWRRWRGGSELIRIGDSRTLVRTGGGVQVSADSPLAPDEHAGFMMTLLRMLAFVPQSAGGGGMPVSAARQPARAAVAAAAPEATTPAAVAADPSSWTALVGRLGLNAMANQLALRCEMTRRTDELIELRISPADERMFDKPYRDKLTAALRQVLGAQVKVMFSSGAVSGASPKAITDRQTGERHAAAVAEIRQDPFVRELIEDFDGSVEDASIQPK